MRFDDARVRNDGPFFSHKLLLHGQQQIGGMRFRSIRGYDNHSLIGHRRRGRGRRAVAAAASAGGNSEQAANQQKARHHAPAEFASARLNPEPHNGKTHEEQHQSSRSDLSCCWGASMAHWG
jgi:hypothetical protein